jgi:hypothetical protein
MTQRTTQQLTLKGSQIYRNNWAGALARTSKAATKR